MPTRIVTVSELKVKLGALMAELEGQGIPLYVTQYGKPKAVLTRYDEYEALLKKVEDLEPYACNEGVPLSPRGRGRQLRGL